MGAATNPPFPPLPPPLYTPSLRAQGSKPEPSIFQNSFFIYKPFFSRLRYSSQEEEKRPRESRMRNCRSVKYETTAAPLLENNKRASPAHAWLFFLFFGRGQVSPRYFIHASATTADFSSVPFHGFPIKEEPPPFYNRKRTRANFMPDLILPYP